MDDSSRANGVSSGRAVLCETDEDGLVLAAPEAQDVALTFPLEHNDDPELTCIACNGKFCSWAVVVYGAGRRVWAGFHDRCARLHSRRIATSCLSSEVVTPSTIKAAQRIAVYQQTDGSWLMRNVPAGEPCEFGSEVVLESVAWFEEGELSWAERYLEFWQNAQSAPELLREKLLEKVVLDLPQYRHYEAYFRGRHGLSARPIQT